MSIEGNTDSASIDERPSGYRGRPIGAILVMEGQLRPTEIDYVRRFAAEEGLRFGEAAVKLNLVNDDDVERALALQFNHPVMARGGENGVADAVVAAYSPHSESVERLRDLRTQVTQTWRSGTDRRILAIASPERREGRSYLAANLATLFARSGERTLLIDADMRHPHQHTLFNLSNSVGLADLLSGHSGKDAVRRIHPQLRLFVLPAGIPPSNPQELAGGRFFDQLLRRFAKLFNVILMDTPAATETADAQVLAATAGYAIMVARRNHTRFSKLSSAMESLTRAGVNVIGSVINEH